MRWLLGKYSSLPIKVHCSWRFRKAPAQISWNEGVNHAVVFAAPRTILCSAEALSCISSQYCAEPSGEESKAGRECLHFRDEDSRAQRGQGEPYCPSPVPSHPLIWLCWGLCTGWRQASPTRKPVFRKKKKERERERERKNCHQQKKRKSVTRLMLLKNATSFLLFPQWFSSRWKSKPVNLAFGPHHIWDFTILNPKGTLLSR